MAGRWILPGLIEMHAHLPAEQAEQERVLRVYLAHGVTTLASLAAAPATGLEAKARLANHELEGSRMFTAGRALNGPNWLDGFQLVVRVESEREVREEVRRRASSGMDFIKVSAHLPSDLVCAAVDEAHGVGLRAVGHLGETRWTRALECGIGVLVHLALGGPTWWLLALREGAGLEHLADPVEMADGPGRALEVDEAVIRTRRSSRRYSLAAGLDAT